MIQIALNQNIIKIKWEKSNSDLRNKFLMNEIEFDLQIQKSHSIK